MKIIIGGAGAVGTHLSKLLSRDHQDCVLIDENPARLSGLDGKFDIMTLCGSPTSIRVLKDAGADKADLFVGVTPDESRNMNACMLAHALGTKKTVARIDNFEYHTRRVIVCFNDFYLAFIVVRSHFPIIARIDV